MVVPTAKVSFIRRVQRFERTMFLSALLLSFERQ